MCFYALDILQKIEKNLLINRHDFLSQSTSIQTSFSNLEQKAKKLAFSYGVSSTHIKQINRWLKLFIRKHEQFRRHFKYKYRLKKGFCNLNGLVTNELTDTDELKNGYSTPTLVSYIIYFSTICLKIWCDFDFYTFIYLHENFLFVSMGQNYVLSLLLGTYVLL